MASTQSVTRTSDGAGVKAAEVEVAERWMQPEVAEGRQRLRLYLTKRIQQALVWQQREACC